MATPFELIAAPHTPFYSDGSVSFGTIDAQCTFLKKNGVHGVFVCGTTGEGLSLTTAERMAVAERWMKASAGSLKVIVHVGHNSNREAAELAAHAKGLGVQGVAALAPHFVKPTTVDDLVAFFAPVAAACTPLPFLYYDLPSLTNVRLNASQVLDTGSKSIPNFAGVKFTNVDAIALSECLTLPSGPFDVYGGVEEMMLSGLVLGLRKAVGSTFNFTSRLHLELVSAYDRRDLGTARDLQRDSIRIVRLLEKYGGPIRAGKALMAWLGVDCGPCRPPLAPMGDVETQRFFADLSIVAGLNS